MTVMTRSAVKKKIALTDDALVKSEEVDTNVKWMQVSPQAASFQAEESSNGLMKQQQEASSVTEATSSLTEQEIEEEMNTADMEKMEATPDATTEKEKDEPNYDWEAHTMSEDDDDYLTRKQLFSSFSSPKKGEKKCKHNTIAWTHAILGCIFILVCCLVIGISPCLDPQQSVLDFPADRNNTRQKSTLFLIRSHVPTKNILSTSFQVPSYPNAVANTFVSQSWSLLSLPREVLSKATVLPRKFFSWSKAILKVVTDATIASVVSKTTTKVS